MHPSRSSAQPRIEIIIPRLSNRPALPPPAPAGRVRRQGRHRARAVLQDVRHALAQVGPLRRQRRAAGDALQGLRHLAGRPARAAGDHRGHGAPHGRRQGAIYFGLAMAIFLFVVGFYFFPDFFLLSSFFLISFFAFSSLFLPLTIPLFLCPSARRTSRRRPSWA